MSMQPEQVLTSPAMGAHLENVAANLQFVADLSYSHVALAARDRQGRLTVLADVRPSNAVAPYATSRVGQVLTPEADPEAFAALTGAALAQPARRAIGGASYLARAIGLQPPAGEAPSGVVICTRAEAIELAAGRMERAFMRSADDLLQGLRAGPLLDARTAEPFSTTRRAGDGVLRVTTAGRIEYASPNAVTIMRLAGVEGRVTGMVAAELPGGGYAISPVVGTSLAMRLDVEVAGRTLGFRSVGTPAGVIALVEDLTEARRHERELELKEATIREVHHRVKNNLQTIASLLRIQARRSGSDEVKRALNEAIERAGSMAAVHDLLARSEHERVDFAAVARIIVDLVRRGLVGNESRIAVSVEGDTGEIDANAATSLALALAEIVHNALEHAFQAEDTGMVQVGLFRDDDALTLSVRDDGRGLPQDFDLQSTSSMGFSIVRTLVEEDLGGTLTIVSERGTTVTLRVPLPSRDGAPGKSRPEWDARS